MDEQLKQKKHAAAKTTPAPTSVPETDGPNAKDNF
jgi:hypothetical protein